MLYHIERIKISISEDSVMVHLVVNIENERLIDIPLREVNLRLVLPLL